MFNWLTISQTFKQFEQIIHPSSYIGYLYICIGVPSVSHEHSKCAVMHSWGTMENESSLCPNSQTTRHSLVFAHDLLAESTTALSHINTWLHNTS